MIVVGTGERSRGLLKVEASKDAVRERREFRKGWAHVVGSKEEVSEK